MEIAINVLDISSFLLLLGYVVFLSFFRGKWKKNKLLVVILLLLALFYLFDHASAYYLSAWLVNLTLYTFFGPLLLAHLRKDLSIHPQPSMHLGHIVFPILNFIFMLWIDLLRWDEDTFYAHPSAYIQVFAIFLSMLYYVAQMLLLHQRARWQATPLPAHKVEWAGSLIAIYGGFTVLALANWFLFPISEDSDAIYLMDSIGSFVLLGAIGIQVLRLNPFPKVERLAPKPMDTETQKWLDLYARLDQQVKEDELFLNPQLRLDDLAKILNTNSRYISRAVNVGHGESFSHYLNTLRLAAFKAGLEDEFRRKMTLDALAQECGFHSRSSLNRFFRQVESMTPSEYRERMVEDE